MEFSVGRGWIAWDVNISDKALITLQNGYDKNQAISDAMTCWQKVANYISRDAHKKAYEQVYDLLQACKSYKDVNSRDEERIGFKKTALEAIGNLRSVAYPECRKLFVPAFNENTGQFSFSMFSGEPIDPATEPAEWQSVRKNILNATGKLEFDLFDSPAAKSHWQAICNCFDDRTKILAMSIFSEACKASDPTARIAAFGKLYELANSADKEKFQIKIIDSESCPAKVSCCIGRRAVFHEACDARENYAKCLIHCDANLFSGAQPTGSSAKMMFWLGRLSKEKFDSIFPKVNQSTATTQLDNMCRDNRNVTDASMRRLIAISGEDADNIEDLFGLRTETDVVPSPPEPITESHMAIIGKKIEDLDSLLKLPLFSYQSKASLFETAKKSLNRQMNEVFGPKSYYSKQAQSLIGRHLSVNAERTGNQLQLAYVKHYFKDELEDSTVQFNQRNSRKPITSGELHAHIIK